MRVIVCGSRTFAKVATLYRVLDEIHEVTPITLLAEGGARGADMHARHWAKGLRLPTSTFPANWRVAGKRAGVLRNQFMLEMVHPDLVVAFVDKPLADSRGTAHMVSIAEKAGVPTRITEVTK